MPARMLDADSIPQLNDPGSEPSITPEIAAVLATVSGGLKDAAKARGMYLYYRKPNGEIGLSPGYITDMLRYMQENWIPLTKYGYVKLSERYQEYPYEALLQKGGAAEFTKEQAIALRFHINPPRVPGCGLLVGQVEPFMFQVEHGLEDPIPGRLHKHDDRCFSEGFVPEFPQFKDGTPEVYECDFCGDVHTTRKGLQSHITVMHRDQLAAHATSEALAQAIVQATKLTATDS